ncbi:MAG TPA: hypothetical protein V6D22_25500 [Candidatus Obscuribacterales bacterium]
MGKTAAKTVVDYYYLLPDELFEVGRKERKLLLDPANRPVIDIAHGYLLAPGDGAQPNMEIALFKKKNGDYVVAVCQKDLETGDTVLNFFGNRNQRLVKLMGMIPVRSNSNFVYKLPRTGTTIEANNQKGKLVHSFAWTGEKFELLK